jgi:hypothetical protein
VIRQRALIYKHFDRFLSTHESFISSKKLLDPVHGWGDFFWFDKLAFDSVEVYVVMEVSVLHGLELYLFAVQCDQKLVLLHWWIEQGTSFERWWYWRVKQKWLIKFYNAKIVFKWLSFWNCHHTEPIHLFDCTRQEFHHVLVLDILAAGHLSQGRGVHWFDHGVDIDVGCEYWWFEGLMLGRDVLGKCGRGKILGMRVEIWFVCW